MKKNKAITLLSLLSVLLVAFFVLTFVHFSVGVKDYNSILGTVEYDYDINGGFSYSAELTEDSDRIDNADKMLATIGGRLSALGYQAYQVTAVKKVVDGVSEEDINYSIVINVKADKDEYGMLDATTSNANIRAALAYGSVKFFGGASSADTEIMNEDVAVKDAFYAGAYNDGGEMKYSVAVVFTDYGFNALKTASDQAGSNFYLKITLGDEVLLNGSFSSTENIQDNTIYITSSTEASAKQTALQIKTGGLEYKFDLDNIEQTEISPLLGENSSFILELAIAIVLVLAIVVIAVLFRGYSLVAFFSLLTFLLTTISMMVAVPGITVSVSGFIGMIFASALMVDGLIVTIKRISEEYANGKTVKAAVKIGYRKSLKPIINSHVISAIVSLLVFILTSGTVKCFGIVLGIATVVSFLVNTLITRLFTSILLPLTEKQESFFNLKREDK